MISVEEVGAWPRSYDNDTILLKGKSLLGLQNNYKYIGPGYAVECFRDIITGQKNKVNANMKRLLDIGNKKVKEQTIYKNENKADNMDHINSLSNLKFEDGQELNPTYNNIALHLALLSNNPNLKIKIEEKAIDYRENPILSLYRYVGHTNPVETETLVSQKLKKIKPVVNEVKNSEIRPNEFEEYLIKEAKTKEDIYNGQSLANFFAFLKREESESYISLPNEDAVVKNISKKFPNKKDIKKVLDWLEVSNINNYTEVFQEILKENKIKNVYLEISEYPIEKNNGEPAILLQPFECHIEVEADEGNELIWALPNVALSLWSNDFNTPLKIKNRDNRDYKPKSVI